LGSYNYSENATLFIAVKQQRYTCHLVFLLQYRKATMVGQNEWLDLPIWHAPGRAPVHYVPALLGETAKMKIEWETEQRRQINQFTNADDL